MTMNEQGLKSGSDGKQTPYTASPYTASPYTASTTRKMFAYFLRKAIILLFNHSSKPDLHIYFENVLSQSEELTSLLPLLPPN